MFDSVCNKSCTKKEYDNNYYWQHTLKRKEDLKKAKKKYMQTEKSKLAQIKSYIGRKNSKYIIQSMLLSWIHSK